MQDRAFNQFEVVTASPLSLNGGAGSVVLGLLLPLLAQVLSDADDVQLYLPLNVDWEDSLHPLLSHLRDIKTWLENYFLKFKIKKT